MANASAGALLTLYCKGRKAWVCNYPLPASSDIPPFVPNPSPISPTLSEPNGKHKVASYRLHIAVLTALKYLGASVGDQVSFSIDSRQVETRVGLVGFVGRDMRVSFLSPHFLYGNPLCATDEDRWAWRH